MQPLLEQPAAEDVTTAAGQLPAPAPGGSALEGRESLRATLREMVTELVHSRELLWQMMLRDIRIRYKQAVMGFGWALFMPMMVVASGFMIKYVMAQLSGMPFDSSGFAAMAIKAMGWAFFVGAIGFAANSLTGNMGLVTKIYFPREVFPLSAVLTQVFDTLIGTAVLVVVLAVVGVPASLAALWVLPLAVLLVLFTAGLAMFLSCANVFFRDVKYLVQVILTFGIFFTPVFYEAELFGPRGATAIMLNPLSPMLEGMRLAVVEQHNLLLPLIAESGTPIWQPWYLAYACGWAVIGSLAAWLVFHKSEFVYAEYI